ncbi:MAG: right-handed parallel beta-helix repeat-containing protein [candidate division KSB1 bacterium]|nr:right-handed parallel beta-helix repeat-containing protein [candidate division KSB1 bacterium]MDZ7273503.1 right-handed parallel beta-helix repeat-containing protein [candidate division KSB1 bacterium]MDZ7286906.1 right-handed parallel beta-helix repeat-containing protein [candidate division KSB1 bacterium]MDZ7299741.1 right-handed parallel beta-helix repeat-containing protein [candidate division KSB1 bacterium]MDZ7305680.1 right-handed parallel beta-helix repeat-containing protein [candidat
MKKVFVLSVGLACAVTLSAYAQIVTPVNLNGWGPANVRADATVAITGDQPRSGTGSLKFTTNTVTPGQDKADFEKIWGVVPGRTLGNLTALRYEFYRDASSTTGGHLAAVLRLYYYNAITGESGLLIWEPVYNGYGTLTTNVWYSADIFTGNFWMRAFGPGRTIDDYNVSLAEWMANTDEEGTPIDDDADADVPHVLNPGVYITGVNVGVGSGWGATFLGYVDNVELEWGSDVEVANFELPPPCTTDCYVDAVLGNDANGGTNPTTDAKKTIQNAVNTVNVGGNVHVASGTYVEQVTITKSLHLLGAGAPTTIVKAPATIPAASNPASTVIDVNGAGVSAEITGFTVSGPGPTGCGSIGAGIFVRGNAHADIHHNKVLDIRDNPISGCQNGIGILVGRASFATSGTATIRNNEIAGYQKGGIVVSNVGSNATIEDNTVTGAGAVNFIAQNGIQVSAGATATLTRNTVSGHSYPPFSYVATGMLLYGSNVDTDDNTLSENQVGIYHINGSGTHQSNSVSATAAGTNSPGFWGIVVDPGTVVRTQPSPFEDGSASTSLGKGGRGSTLAATYTYLLDQNVVNSDGSAGGVGVEADALGSDVVNFTATGNTVSNWEYGIYLYKDAGATLNANIIDCNKIYGNTAYGLYNSTGVEANAVGNWWGAANGPGGSGPGSGDAVSTEVNFAPWGTDANCGGLLYHNYVFLADYVSIERSKQVPSKGDIHSNGKIDFMRGDPTVFEGNLTAVGNINIGKENTIDGYAHAAGTVTVHATSTVLDGVLSGAAISAQPIPAMSYSAGGPSVTVPQNGTVTLAPGSYNVVTMNGWSTLKLSSGDYYLNQLKYVGEESVIEIDVSNGPVIVNVVSSLQLGKDIAIQIVPDGEAGSTKVVFNTLQTTTMTIGKEAYVLGSINAPSATVVLSNNSQFRGGLCAKAIQVKRDVFFLHHFSSGTLPGPGDLPKPHDSESEETAAVVTQYELAQNYPNPFNPGTVIKFALPQVGRVQLHIYNSTGQLVRTLVDGEMAQGWHELSWDGRDQTGQTMATGIYLYRLTAQDASGGTLFSETRRMIMVK